MLKQKKEYLKVFFLCFFSMLIILSVNVIKNHGFFTYAGDYAFQQIPFYFHVSDAVWSGEIGWDWFTDLGSDLIGSYSFYLFGSIFFWSISWLPGKLIIYAMPVMIAIKTGIAGVTSYAYIRRYVKNNDAAFIGALMYAFSGYQMFNLIYNHFHDVTALFPLLLLSFDMLVTEDKKVFFAVMTCITAFTNYFFFFGEAVFIIIYYIVRCTKKDFRFSVRGFVCIAVESVIGASVAAILIVPSLVTVSSGNRVSDILNGTDLISYSDNTILPKIIQSLFMIPDFPSNSLLFQSAENSHNWASISLFLPVFTIVGVVSYIKINQKQWASLLLKICLLIASVPLFNSAFYLFNSSYYARWFYMPILLMCMITAKSLEEKTDLKFGIKVQAIALAVLGCIALLPKKVPKKSDDLSMMLDKSASVEKVLKPFAMSDVPIAFWQFFGFGAVFVLIVYVYNSLKEKDINILKKITYAMTGLIIIINIIYINSTVEYIDFKDYNETAIEFTPHINDESGFFRITDIHNSMVNNNMMWRYSPAGSFHSIVSPGSEEFYSGVAGSKRMMKPEYEKSDYPVYGLLSVKYIFNRSTGDDLNVELYPAELNGCSLYDKQGYYYIYINDHFVPMGHTYNYCISQKDISEYMDKLDMDDESKRQYKQFIMMRALVLSEEDADRYADVIRAIPENMLSDLDEETYYSDCDDRAAESCSKFEYDSHGFTAEITTENPEIVYFSVPVNKGWTAEVNGEKTDIITAQYGLSAVKVNGGKSEIRFSYETYGLRCGIYISISAVIALIVYSFIAVTIKKRKNIHKT